MNHTQIRTRLTTRHLLTLCLVAAPALAQTPHPLPGPGAVPELGALPGQAPVVSFTPLAQQAQGAAAPGTPAPATVPAAARTAQASQATVRRGAPSNAHGIEHTLFDRRPVAVTLRVDQERLVRLPFLVMLEVPPELTGVLEAQMIEDTAYLTALEPIRRSRVLAHALDGSAVIPLDIHASDKGDAKPELEVHYPSAESAGATGGASADQPEPARPDMVQLTRHAAQALYSPRRLLRPLPGVRQSEVSRSPVALYRDAKVITAPLGAWTSGELFVTAVRFSNASSEALELDMERLRGRWIAATPQHWRLHARGSEADTTVVYLVSAHAFDAIREE